jgi:acyl carrier protein
VSSINDRLSALITAKFGVPSAEIQPEATLEQLEFDSLVAAELAVTLQDEFDVQIGEDDLPPELTVAGLVALLNSKVVAA